MTRAVISYSDGRNTVITTELSDNADIEILELIVDRAKKQLRLDPESDRPKCFGADYVCETCNNDYSKCVGGGPHIRLNAPVRT